MVDWTDKEANLMIADGLDAAIAGVGRRCGQPDLVVYHVEKVIDILMERDGMTNEEAWEFFNFNIEGAWMGELTPVWLHLPDRFEIETG
jgi:hypothetical protein